MLIEEAKWFGKKISEMNPSAIFPMCDVGSSTGKFREKIQPWIDEYIFKPAREKKQPVRHLDIKDASGVDIVGDLSDRHFSKKLSEKGFKSVFCSNLLEHVHNREELCQALISIIPIGGYLFVSCPFKYPFHPDPIDTRFRPDKDELARLFPGTRVYRGEVVICETYLDYVTSSPLKLIKAAVRIFIPFYQPVGWFSALMRVPWLFRNFQVTCLILRRGSERSYDRVP